MQFKHRIAPQKRFASYAWFVLAFAIAVVLWGAGVRIWHPIVAALLGCFLVAFALAFGVRKHRAPRARRLALAVVLLIIPQTGAGIINVLPRAPAWPQITHLFIADSLWIALVLLIAEMIAFGGNNPTETPFLGRPFPWEGGCCGC